MHACRLSVAWRSGLRLPLPFSVPAASTRSLSSEASALPDREKVEYDVVIVGAGPAGLSAAIQLKKKAAAGGREVSVCVVEKGHEVGAHILSGNVLETRALDELIPDWKDKGAPLETRATEDEFYYLTESRSFRMPTIPLLHNHGNYITSLSRVVKWLGAQAEAAGVDIFPGTPVSEVLYGDAGDARSPVVGVATADAGVGRDGARKGSFSRGMEIRGSQTLFAEGARGSCSEAVQARFGLRAGCDPQSFGLGVKEVWRVPKARARPGYIQHTLGWPLPSDVYGGSFLYHWGEDLVSLGFVVGLDYANPTLSPYAEMQRWKHHPRVRAHLEGGECIQYGARVINEGGLQAVPKLTFPGGALIGCSAGFVNVPKIKGTHTAMKSAMVAADAIYDALADGSAANGGEVSRYQRDLEASWVWSELRSVRNYHPSFKFGQLAGLAYSGLSAFVLRGREPWTFHSAHTDAAATVPLKDCTPIVYPKPDGVLSFDLLSNLARSGTAHEADQPPHLRIKPGMEDAPAQVSYAVYGAPEQHFCPAKVYEYPEPGKLVINAANCVHCKTCDIKTPANYIKWTVPEAGGGGPAYDVM